MNHDIIITNEVQLYTPDDKKLWWGEGAWCEELDEINFKYKNYQCKVIRIAMPEPCAKEFHMFGGHLCGYVKIPNDNALHGKEYDNINVDCHYGLTYGEINDDQHWIGFDCAHSSDYNPSMEYLKKTNPALKEAYSRMPGSMKDHPLFNPTYKNINFCISECKGIVNQLIEISKENLKDEKS